MPRIFKQVDVFTKTPFKGNAVAVFYDADDLSTEQMQQIANWTNLAETTFVLRPTKGVADYKLRIFSPTSELPFAGHPTVGSCFALLESGVIEPNENGEVIQECAAGLVPIKLKEDTLTFKLPHYRFSDIPQDSIALLADALGVELNSIITTPELAEVGPKFIVTHLTDAEKILNLKPNLQKISSLLVRLGASGIQTFGVHKNGELEARTFAPLIGVNEDFACGSGSGAIGAFTLKNKLFSNKTLVVKQGKKVSRDAQLNITISGNDIYVGGSAVTCLEGTSKI